MKTKGIILKSVSLLLLAVIVHMHLCSALCATGTSVCCDKEEDNDHHNKKECYSHDKGSENKDNDCQDNDCQDMHFAFFIATGQFTQVKADITFNPFQPLIAVVTPLFNFQPLEADKTLFAYNNFHPPPTHADIRILIQSFLI